MQEAYLFEKFATARQVRRKFTVRHLEKCHRAERQDSRTRRQIWRREKEVSKGMYVGNSGIEGEGEEEGG